jgi:acetyl-CoA C-acetyltransferase
MDNYVISSLKRAQRAIEQSHSLGSIGSRILSTLMYALQRYGKKKGVAALYIGGDESTAMANEML